MSPRPPRPTLFPYTTLFRSNTRRAIDIREGEKVDAGAFKALVKAAVAQNDRKKAKPGASEAKPTRMQKNEKGRSEEHTSELQSLAYLVCRLLLEKKKKKKKR